MPARSHDQMLLATARAEQERMQDALTQIQPGGAVRVSREQFARLAELIGQLAARRIEHDPEDFNSPVDGVRWWIPLPEFLRSRADLTDLAHHSDGVTIDCEAVRSKH